MYDGLLSIAFCSSVCLKGHIAYDRSMVIWVKTKGHMGQGQPQYKQMGSHQRQVASLE